MFEWFFSFAGFFFFICVSTLVTRSFWIRNLWTNFIKFGCINSVNYRVIHFKTHATTFIIFSISFAALTTHFLKDFQTSRKGGQPFSLNIKISHQKKKTDVVAEKLVNKKTNEQLSINCEEMGNEGRIALITIKRAKIWDHSWICVWTV